MTNPDRDELVKLADRLAALPTFKMETVVTVPGVACNERERDLIVTALRRLASSDSGVKGEPEPVAWQYELADGREWSNGKPGQYTGWHEHLSKTKPNVPEGSIRNLEPLYTAPPADAGMREACMRILPYLRWTISDESPGHHPTMPSAVAEFEAALTAPGATTKSDGGDLPANLAEIIETELTAWRGVNGGVFTIHAAALGISCAIRSAVFRANNTESDGGHGGQPYASTDAVEGASAPNATSGKQEGRTGIEVGASQTPGSSMSSGQSAPIVAGQAPAPSDPSSTRSEVTALADIAAERQRQREVEGWTPEYDDAHVSAELAMAGACYALASFLNTEHALNTTFTRYWPWDRKWWKPKTPRENLVRAGALIVAEIERLDRLDQFEIRRK